MKIQIDETAICISRIISNLSSASDSMDGTQWIVGGVLDNDSALFPQSYCLKEDGKH